MFDNNIVVKNIDHLIDFYIMLSIYSITSWNENTHTHTHCETPEVDLFESNRMFGLVRALIVLVIKTRLLL